MSTTSKLGADMTDEQLIEIASHYAHSDGWLNGDGALNFARALLARQPAAIDKQEATIRDRARRFLSEFDRQTGISMSDHVQEVMLNLFLRYAAPLANEASKPAPKYDPCDPGNWRDGDDAMGNAAPSVEQDERAAFEADYAMVWNAAMKENGWGGGHTADDVKAMREGNTYGEGRDYLNSRWEGWQARALLQSNATLPEGFAVKHVEGHGWIVDPPSGSRWVAFEGTPAGELMEALSTAPAQSCGDAEQADEAVTDDVFDWLETEVTAISCRYYGDPSYDHDAYWMRDRVVKLIGEARNTFAARTKDSK